MKLTTKQIVLLALTLVTISVFLISGINADGDAAALNFTDPPAGFTGVESVDFEVNSGYAWHEMTEEEASALQLTGHTGPIYLAGNSKVEPPNGTQTVSNLAIKVTEPGMLTFEYALSARPDSWATKEFFGYRIGAKITTENTKNDCPVIAQGDKHPANNDSWQSCTITVSESDFAGLSEVIVYIAYAHGQYVSSQNYLNYAAIRNVQYLTGNQNEVIRFDPEQGTVTAELETATDTSEKDSDGNPVKKYSYSPVSLDELTIGNTYRFTATANAGYQLYGWEKHSADEHGADVVEYQTVKDGKLYVTISSSAYYTPVFAPVGSHVVRNGRVFYDGEDALETALTNAKIGDTLVLLQDVTISKDTVVPTGVTLYIPFREHWEKEEVGYDEYGFLVQHHLSTKNKALCHKNIADEDETYIRLTINEGVKLSVDGTVAIGAVIGYPDQGIQGHVSGAHGRITNNGRIEVNEGGLLKCYGIVDGTGVTYIHDGGILKETFIIGDFAGGSNSANLFFTSQMPFKRFSLQSVQCELQMEAKAKLISMINAWAQSMFNRAEVAMVGDDSKAAFYPTSDGADVLAVTRIYHPDQALIDNNSKDKTLLGVSGVGRTEWIFSNGLEFQPLTIEFAGIELNTASSDLTIPYNFKIRLVQGEYTIPLGMRLMPGAEMIVESGASAVVGTGMVNNNKIYGRLMILNGLVQSDILNVQGCRYPTRAELEAAGFSGCAEFILDGTLTLKADTTLGGVVKTNGGGKLVIEQGVFLNNSGDLTQLNPSKELADHPYNQYTGEGGVSRPEFNKTKVHNWVQQDGAKGAYDENTTWFNLPAMIYTANGLQKIESGKTYESSVLSTEESVEYNVDYLYVADGVYSQSGYHTASGEREMVTATETVTRTMSGMWTDGSQTDTTVEVKDITVAGSDKSGSLTNNVTIVFDKSKEGANTILSNLRPVDATTQESKNEKYVYLVKYTVEGNSTGYTIKPDANGNYVIPAEANGVTIESCLLGDLTSDGQIKANDYKKLKSFILEKITSDDVGELGLLSSDITGDGLIKANDYKKLKSYILEKISSL